MCRPIQLAYNSYIRMSIILILIMIKKILKPWIIIILLLLLLFYFFNFRLNVPGSNGITKGCCRTLGIRQKFLATLDLSNTYIGGLNYICM